MVYPNDTYIFLLSVTKADGGDPNVTAAPTITVLNAASGQVVSAAAPMTLIDGTRKVYSYAWDTTGQTDGAYIGVVSYAADGVTIQGQLLETVRLGDARVKGPVALDATVAKDSTVAKDATVMHYREYVLPKNDDYVRSIYSKVQLIPANPATAEAITSLGLKLEDIHDFVMGTWVVDKVAKTMTLRRKDGSVLTTFNIADTDTTSSRIKA
jgi:hypothetical protein